MTLVVDASAINELLLPSFPERRLAVQTALSGELHWVVPEHFTLEVINSLRGRLLGRRIDRAQFDAAVGSFGTFDFDVWPTAGLLPRIIELMNNATPYDAAYLALAEELACPLLTADAKLGAVPGIRCRVVVAG